MNVTRPEAEGLVVSLILDERIKGKIDQVQGLLVLERLYVLFSHLNLTIRKEADVSDSNTTSVKRYEALNGMSKELGNLNKRIVMDKMVRGEGRSWGPAGMAFA